MKKKRKYKEKKLEFENKIAQLYWENEYPVK